MEKNISAAVVRPQIDNSFYARKNRFKNHSLTEAIIVFSLLLFFFAFLLFVFFTSKTNAAPFSFALIYEQKSIGGINLSSDEFSSSANFSSGVNKASIYRNGRDRTGGIALPVFPAEGRLTSRFGGRSNPFGTGGGEFHAGLDVAAPTGTAVLAAADGIVTFAGWKGGYGNVIIIEHDGQQVVTRYGHLSRIYVKEGDTVTAGRLIGSVGSTGRSTGPHLHYEVRIDGKPTNPLAYHSQSQAE